MIWDQEGDHEVLYDLSWVSNHDSSSCLPALYTLRKAVFLPEHYFLFPVSVAANLRNLKLTVFAVGGLWKCLDDLQPGSVTSQGDCGLRYFVWTSNLPQKKQTLLLASELKGEHLNKFMVVCRAVIGSQKLFSPISAPSFFKFCSLAVETPTQCLCPWTWSWWIRGVGPGCSPSPPMVHASPTKVSAVLICSAGSELQLAPHGIHFPVAAIDLKALGRGVQDEHHGQ